MVALVVRSEGSLRIEVAETDSIDRQIGRGNMGIVWVFARTGAAFTALVTISALSGPAQAQTPDISGTYWATEYRAKIQIVGGGDLPLTPKGKAEYEKNMAGLKDGSITDAARKFCVPDGLPRVLATPYPFEIIQAPPGQVTIIHELTTRFASSPWANRCRR